MIEIETSNIKVCLCGARRLILLELPLHVLGYPQDLHLPRQRCMYMLGRSAMYVLD